MTTLSMNAMDVAKATTWEAYAVLDEKTSEPTGEVIERRVVPSADGRHVAVQERRPAGAGYAELSQELPADPMP
ncbi:hypothetical protein [uncultured Microbacterium sp.]|uniref:hypothetical protein n=1 Tax=uncultured Microbacterium sp. TaxID=191216 RepID=UPI0025F8E132|nr:hypothetical protein [uncultured Microbacterium sp.]